MLWVYKQIYIYIYVFIIIIYICICINDVYSYLPANGLPKASTNLTSSRNPDSTLCFINRVSLHSTFPVFPIVFTVFPVFPVSA